MSPTLQLLSPRRGGGGRGGGGGGGFGSGVGSLGSLDAKTTGIVVGSVAGAIVLALWVWYLRRCRRKGYRWSHVLASHAWCLSGGLCCACCCAGAEARVWDPVWSRLRERDAAAAMARRRAEEKDKEEADVEKGRCGYHVGEEMRMPMPMSMPIPEPVHASRRAERQEEEGDAERIVRMARERIRREREERERMAEHRPGLVSIGTMSRLEMLGLDGIARRMTGAGAGAPAKAKTGEKPEESDTEMLIPGRGRVSVDSSVGPRDVSPHSCEGFLGRR